MYGFNELVTIGVVDDGMYPIPQFALPHHIRIALFCSTAHTWSQVEGAYAKLSLRVLLLLADAGYPKYNSAVFAPKIANLPKALLHVISRTLVGDPPLPRFDVGSIHMQAVKLV